MSAQDLMATGGVYLAVLIFSDKFRADSSDINQIIGNISVN